MGRFGDRPRVDKLGLAVLQLAGWLILGGMFFVLYRLFI